MAFNENTRVKIPAILHLCRLGYQYLSLTGTRWDLNTNIFSNIFSSSVKSINADRNLEDSDIKKLLEDISLCLDNEDLGEALSFDNISVTVRKLRRKKLAEALVSKGDAQPRFQLNDHECYNINHIK